MKAAAAAVMAVCAASAAHAAGFLLTEQSAAGLGRAYAGIGVDGTDISGVYYNPATMTLHPGTAIQAGFVGIGLDLAYESNDGSITENGQYNTQAIPHGYISHQLTDNMWIGLAMTVPFGMGTEYKDEWPLANRGISAEVLTFDFNPNVAWKVSDKLSLGAGISIQYAAADLKLRKDQASGMSVNSEVDADSFAWGFNAGLMWSPLENLRFGLSYRSRINHNADGDVTLSGNEGIVGMLGPKHDATATISTPAWLMATAAWDVNDLLSLYATFRWTDWSSFDELTIKTNHPLVGDSIKNKWQDTYLFLLVRTFALPTGGHSVPVSAMKLLLWMIPSTVRPSFRMPIAGGLLWVPLSRQPKICRSTFPLRGCTARASAICGTAMTRLTVSLLAVSKTLTPTSSAFSWFTSSNLA